MSERGDITLPVAAALAAVVSPLPIHAILSQASSGTEVGSDWSTILQQFGPFLPFALLCLFIMQKLWNKVTFLEEQLTAAQDVTISEVVPALTEANTLLSKNAEELARATEVLHVVNARPEMDADLWRRVVNALERSERGDHA